MSQRKAASSCRGESGWCLEVTSTHGAWGHAEVQFLIPGDLCESAGRQKPKSKTRKLATHSRAREAPRLPKARKKVICALAWCMPVVGFPSSAVLLASPALSVSGRAPRQPASVHGRPVEENHRPEIHTEVAQACCPDPGALNSASPGGKHRHNQVGEQAPRQGEASRRKQASRTRGLARWVGQHGRLQLSSSEHWRRPAIADTNLFSDVFPHLAVAGSAS